MRCSNGRVNPDGTTRVRLFADSGGFCQKPDCLKPLFKDFDKDAIHLAEMAHIIAASKGGPRSTERLSEKEKAEYSNLILLCPSCHVEIDKAIDHYPVGTILAWKSEHRERLNRAFGIIRCANRADGRRLAKRFLRENRTAFELYGPMGDERFNPESSLPRLWSIKMLDTILPNNRKLLSLCDVNEALLTDEELLTVERFRQHVADLEARHVSQKDVCGIMYPIEMNSIFSETES